MSYFRAQIERIPGYVPGEQPQAGKFVKLNTNENPYPCSPRVKQAIGRTCSAGLERYPDPMATAFRIRAGEIFNVDPDWILCGNGSDDLLTIVTRAFVNPDDCVRFPTPSYVLYRTLAEIQGAQYEEILFNSDWTLSDKFSASGPRLKLVYLPNPNSPSGTTLSPDAILQIAERLPCPLIVDEAYADFADVNCISLVTQQEKIIVTRSMSKSYGLAGLRFGFLVAQPSLIQQLIKVKDSYNCDALSVAGATAAIDDQAWWQENRTKVLATRETLTSATRDLGFDVVPSQANFIWITHPERPMRPLYEQLKEQQVLVRYMDFPGRGDGLRISVGTDAQVRVCVDLLRRLV